MRKKLWMILLVMLWVSGWVFTTSCSKKTVATKNDVYGSSTEEVSTPQETDMKAESLEQSEVIPGTGSGKIVMMIMLEDIYFEFDKSTLTSEAKDALMQKTEWLKANPHAKVLIEGHCDERGTNEYNLALGDRRAEAVKTFLINLGISPLRLDSISYGEERPADFGHGEAAWANNRRAHFALK
jgi:peptidoglycan-associated lipoprotein